MWGLDVCVYVVWGRMGYNVCLCICVEIECAHARVCVCACMYACLCAYMCLCRDEVVYVCVCM